MDPTLAIILGFAAAYFMFHASSTGGAPTNPVGTSTVTGGSPPRQVNTPSDPNQAPLPTTASTDPVPVNMGAVNPVETPVGGKLTGLGVGSGLPTGNPPVGSVLDTAGGSVNLYGTGFGNQNAGNTYGSGITKTPTRYQPLSGDMANSALSHQGGYVIGSGYH
jgi:hypothetical protein